MPELTDRTIDADALADLITGLPAKIGTVCLRLLVAFIVATLLWKLINLLTKWLRRSMERAKADPGVISFTASFTGVALKLLVVFGVAITLGFNTASIVAILGSAGVAIGLALQGSLSNLAGGIMILALRPFRVGDYILEDAHGHEGTVREISLFHTKLDTIDNKVVVLPNGDLANTALVNLTGRTARMLEIKIGVAYDTDMDRAKEVLRGVAESNPLVLKDRDIFVFVDAFADSAMIMGIRMWVPTDGFTKRRWEMNEAVKSALDEAGIEIPYPRIDVSKR